MPWFQESTANLLHGKFLYMWQNLNPCAFFGIPQLQTQTHGLYFYLCKMVLTYRCSCMQDHFDYWVKTVFGLKNGSTFNDKSENVTTYLEERWQNLKKILGPDMI